MYTEMSTDISMYYKKKNYLIFTLVEIYKIPFLINSLIVGFKI